MLEHPILSYKKKSVQLEVENKELNEPLIYSSGPSGTY